MRRVDLEVYRLSVDTLIIPRYPSRFILNLALNILEFCEPSIRDMMELCPLWLYCDARCGIRFRAIVIGWDIDELQNQRSSSNNTASTREEISPNDVFENRGFARGL